MPLKPHAANIDDEDPDDLTSAPRPSAPAGPVVAVPELTHPGGSASNGLSERAVETLEDFVRAWMTALQAHIRTPLTMTHPLAAWVVEHSAYLLNTCMFGNDGRTAYGRLHGKERRERLCELGVQTAFVLFGPVT